MKRWIGSLAVGSALIALTPLAAQARVAEVGWWTRNPAASAPADGIQVANGLDGPLSVAAVRAGDGSGSVTSAKLTLKEADGSVNAAGASLQACPAAGTFEAKANGAFADAPKADCAAGKVALQRDAATGTWTAEVGPLLPTGTSAISIVPAGTAVFQVNFTKPGLDVQTSSSAGGGLAASDTFNTNEFTSSGSSSDTSSSVSSTSSGSSSFDSGSFDSGTTTFTPSGSTFTAPNETLFAPAAGTDAAAATDGPGDVATGDGSSAIETAAGPSFTRRTAALADAQTGGNRGAKFAGFLLVSAIIGTAAGFGRHRMSARLSS